MDKFNLFTEIEQNAKLRGSHIALRNREKSVTYDQMIEAANFAASSLSSIGMFKYSKCLLIGENSPEYIFTALGIISQFGVFISAGKEISNSQFNSLLAKLAIDFIIIEEKYDSKLIPLNYLKKKTLKIGDKKFLLFKSSITTDRKSDNFKEFSKLNPAFIRFTSGTTSKSKGVVLSHQTIKERTETANSAFQISEKDNILWLLPMAYHFAVTIILFLRKGATIDISNSLKPSEIVKKLKEPKVTTKKELISSDKITFVYATPYHYSNMTNASTSTQNKEKISDSVRLLISTAMPLSEEIFAEFAKKFDRFINQAYGIIECGLPAINITPSSINGDSVGNHLLGYQIRLALENDDDTFGEIAIKGPGFFDAYLDPWKTKRSILSNGWFYTGDIGTFNKDRTLKIIGRKKSMINFLGLKVFPEVVENILLQHKYIIDIRVFGEKHSTFGEIVIAEYVTKNNKEISSSELTKFCLNSLSTHEIPQEFRPMTTINKTGSGKVIRHI